MDALFASIISFIGATRYGFLFVGTFIGGPPLMVAAGYFIHTHQLEFIPTYLTFVSADIVGDIVWYWVGRKGARSFLERYGRHFGFSHELVERLEQRFLKYHDRILIISKLTMGFGVAIAVLTVAGIMRVPFWRYLGINIAGELLWALIPLSIGFYFGDIADTLPSSVHLWFVIMSFIATIGMMRFVVKKIATKEW